MKRTFNCCLISLGLLSAGMLPVALQAQPRTSQPAAPAVAAQAQPRKQGQERHPEIRAAIRALENAKHHLESGSHDFSGHRVKALEHVNQALQECREALQADKD